MTETTSSKRTFTSKDGQATITLISDASGNLHIVRGQRLNGVTLARKVFQHLADARAFANELWAAPVPVAKEEFRPNALERTFEAGQDRQARQADRSTGAVGRAADRDGAGRATVVPAGHYAVEYLGTMRFYAVVEGKGRWAGRTFVNRYHSDDLLDVHRTEAFAVRAEIAKDVEAAGRRFVELTTRCRRCARRLTDLETAKVNGGFGPECVKKV
jgi:Family of unknown function (DUF6011)